MFSRLSPEQMLEAVLKDYQALAGGNPLLLRSGIPEKEVWRFFIERPLQKHGRGLSLIKAFQNSKFLSLTVKEYIETEEKLDFKKSKTMQQSKLLKRMRKYGWTLSKEQCEKFTLTDLLKIDRGWIPFEINEPGYLKAMVSAFQEIFTEQPLDLNFILRLHALCLNNVKGSNYDDGEEIPGSFRKIEKMRFLLTKTCASREGIKEFLDRPFYLNPEQSIRLIIFKGNDSIGAILVNPGAIEDFIKNPDIKESDDDFQKYLKSNPILMTMLNHIASAKNNEEIAYVLFNLIDKPYENVQVFFYSSQEGAPKVNERLRLAMQDYLNQFTTAFGQAETTLDKLKAIVEYISACGLLHPFKDGNGRVFHMLLSNYLLFREKLPLAIFNDSNHFNLFSKDEMLRDLIKGMANTMKLIKQGSLFDVLTDDILRELHSKSVFQPMLTYFQETQKIEEAGKKATNAPRPSK